jgi:hypothetical protein
MKSITASAFKANYLHLMDEVATTGGAPYYYQAWPTGVSTGPLSTQSPDPLWSASGEYHDYRRPHRAD